MKIIILAITVNALILAFQVTTHHPYGIALGCLIAGLIGMIMFLVGSRRRS